MIIPKNEHKHFYKFNLNNDIPVIYVKDNNLDNPAFYLGVSVGYFSDPIETPGLAHFLEHLIFMGSSKYPKENYFNERLSEYNGMTNAYTDTNKTVYYFSCTFNGFKEILNIFFNLIKSPLLSQSSQEREVLAVNSEHEKNILNDSWRYYRLLGILSNKDHPLYKFGTGNKETLNKKTVIKQVRDFFNTFYHSKNYFICLAGKENKKYYQDLLNSTFGTLETSPSKTKNIYNLNLPFPEHSKYIYLPSENNSKKISLIWSLPWIEKSMNPLSLINEVMTNLKINSLQKILLNNKLIKSMGLSLDDDSGNFIIVMIVINLSKDGISQISKIISIVKNYLEFISKQNLNHLINEFKNKNIINFNYNTNLGSFDLISEIIESMIETNEPLFYHYDYSNLKQTNIQSILSQLNSIEPNVLLQLPQNEFNKINLKIIKHDEEKYYNMKFSYLEKPHSVKLDIDFEIPTKNKYLQTPQMITTPDTKLVKIKNNYYHFNSSWKTPISYISIIIDYPYFKNNLLAINQTILILDYQIKEYFYDALLLDYNIDILPYPHKNILLINISGYNSKNIDIINELFTKLKTFPNLQKYIELVNQEYKNSLEKYKTATPIELVREEFKTQILPNYFNRKYLLDNYQEININKFSYLIDKIINSKKIFYQFGNFNKKLISNNTFDINILPNNNLSNIAMIHPNKKEQNKAILISYNLGKYNLKISALSTVLNNIMSEYFFDELRTKQQLGYLVKQYVDITNNNIYLIQIIQSQEDLNKIKNLIKQFNNNFLIILQKMTETNITNIKNNLITTILSPFQSMEEQYSFEIKEIISNRLKFNRKKLLANEINKITQNDLINLLKAFKNKGIVLTNQY